MNKFLLLLALMSTPTLANDFLDKTYITIGVGYKFQETTVKFDDVYFKDPYSARIELGYYYSDNVKFGISHHSQWLTGFPIDNLDNEPYKTEIFIDYTFTLSDLF